MVRRYAQVALPILALLLSAVGSINSPKSNPKYALPPSSAHSSQSISISIEFNSREVAVTYTFDPSTSDTNDAYTTAKEFCTSYGITDTTCTDSVAFKLVEEGAPVLISNFGVKSEIAPLVAFAGYLYSNGRPKMSVSLLESCMMAMGLLPTFKSRPSHFEVMAYDLLAASYHGSDLTNKAASVYQYLLDSHDEDGATVSKPELATNYAVNLLDQGDYEKSRELFEIALVATRELDPPNLLLLSQIFMERATLAAEDFKKEDGDPIEFVQRSIFILKTMEKEIPKKEEEGAGAMEIKENLAQAFLTMGKLQLDRRENSQAIRSLRQALRYSPNHVEAITTMQHAEDMPSYDENFPPITEATITTESTSTEFVTFASDPEKCELQRLLASARHFGVEFTVLGQGYPTAQWKNGLKLELLLDFLEGLPENKLVVVVDGYDVVLSGGAKDFIDRFNIILTLNPPQNAILYPDDPKPVIFQADYTFYCPLMDPQLSASIAKAYPSSPTKYKFLSSGGIAAESSALKKLVRDTLFRYDTEEWEKKSDQSLFIRYLVDNQDNERAVPIIVDHFQVMFGGNGGNFMKDFEVTEEGRLRHKKTGTFPVSLHTPGRRKHQKEMLKLREEGWHAEIVDCTKPIFTI